MTHPIEPTPSNASENHNRSEKTAGQQMIELKPCPFCGSKKLHVEAGGWVMCEDCLSDGPGVLGTPKDEAIAGWNRRIDADRLTLEKEVEILREALNRIAQTPMTYSMPFSTQELVLIAREALSAIPEVSGKETR